MKLVVLFDSPVFTQYRLRYVSALFSLPLYAFMIYLGLLSFLSFTWIFNNIFYTTQLRKLNAYVRAKASDPLRLQYSR